MNLRGKARFVIVFFQLMRYSDNLLDTARWLYQMRRKYRGQPSLAKFRLGDIVFACRTRDWPTVEEILLLDEYGFINQLTFHQPRILDLGANIGLFSIHCINQFPDAMVLSVEASPATFDILRANQTRYPQKHWQIGHYAVWHTECEVRFIDEEMSTGSHVNQTGSIKVPAITLDRLINEQCHGRVDLLKMDIEGAEQAVLEQAESSLMNVEHLILEVHPDKASWNEVLQLVNRNFRYVHLIPRKTSTKPLIFASKSINRMSE